MSGRSAVAYATLAGHKLAGEERMAVVWAHDGTVTFDVLSISRGSGLVGRALFALLASTQRRFFGEQVSCMQRLLGA